MGLSKERSPIPKPCVAARFVGVLASPAKVMDTREIDVLVQRLLQNPHDSEALSYAHREGMRDPRSYALILEKVGAACTDPAYASHWLTEAANVWSTSLGDAHRTARLLMMALERDPSFDLAAERLAQLYRDHGEKKALAALLERRVKALEPLTAHSEETRAHVASLYEELGGLFLEAPLSQPKRAMERYRRAIELDPQLLSAIYSLRELYKAEEQLEEALPLFEAEQAQIADPMRKVALYRDEAAVRDLAGDREGALAALRAARALDPSDAVVAQELGSRILERVSAGEAISSGDREEGVSAFVMLAETYDGEHGFAYACAALDLDPGHDRAMQLAAHWAGTLGREGELGERWAAYLAANPGGALAEQASQHTAPHDAPAEAALLEDDPEEVIEDPPELLPLDDAENPLFSASDIPALFASAQRASEQGKIDEALASFKEVLDIDPTHPEAFSWVEDHYRQKRDYASLRELLGQAARAPQASREARKQHYREMAGLSETHLRDLDGAIFAYRQISQLDRGDESARDQLRRILERAGKWDDLALFFEQEAMGAPDIEARISLERRLAQLHESKRNDLAAAGEAWARIASLIPEDESAIATSIGLFTRASRLDLGAQTIEDHLNAVDDDAQRAALLAKLGELREQLNEPSSAGDAFMAAARLHPSRSLFRAAARSFTAAERYFEAANAIAEQANLTDGAEQAELFAEEGDLLVRAGDEGRALASFEQALALDPSNPDYAEAVDSRLEAAGRFDDLIASWLARASKVNEKSKRIELRKRAAKLQIERLDDRSSARESLLAVLDDGDDAEALAILVDFAEDQRDFDEAVSLLRRLERLSSTKDEKIELLLREARILAEGLSDEEAAIERYEEILTELDPDHLPALEGAALLYEQRGESERLAKILEKRLALAGDEAETIELARRLSTLYEALGDDARAMASLERVHRLDDEDFDAIARMLAIAERTGDAARAAELLSLLIEVEGDDEELSTMSRKLSRLLADELDRGEEALRVLIELADAGDASCREDYVALGDRLGRSETVARKLLDWHLSAQPSEARTAALSGAFDRFIVTGHDADAVQVGMQLVRASDSAELSSKLEEVASRTRDLHALSTAHERLARGLSGKERAFELLRQAEVLVSAGMDPVESRVHGEQGLVSLPPEEAEAFLARLAKLCKTDDEVVELYERQAARAKQPEDKLRAAVRAAEVALEKGLTDRAKNMLGLALSGPLQEEALDALEATVRALDEAKGETSLQAMLVETFAQGGQGLRDGGKTRSLLLRRAATLAELRLSATERAFGLLEDALTAHVDEAGLAQLRALGEQLGDFPRVDEAIERVLGEVFDGPFVRQLLTFRIDLRRGALANLAGAAEDLKRLYDLSPSDTALADELTKLLTELGDHRGMVQLLEDRILRGRDPHLRAELARKVARIWEAPLDEPREAADAWRRVLRMKPGDEEAQEGLERAKATMLERGSRDSIAPRLSAPPPARRSAPPARASVRPPPPRSSAPSVASSRSASLPPPPPPMRRSEPDLPYEESALLAVSDAELLDEPSPMMPPPMPAMPVPPMSAAGLMHSGPPALPDAVSEDEVMMVDDAELLDGED